jgi:hypothetical protein
MYGAPWQAAPVDRSWLPSEPAFRRGSSSRWQAKDGAAQDWTRCKEREPGRTGGVYVYVEDASRRAVTPQIVRDLRRKCKGGVGRSPFSNPQAASIAVLITRRSPGKCLITTVPCEACHREHRLLAVASTAMVSAGFPSFQAR